MHFKLETAHKLNARELLFVPELSRCRFLSVFLLQMDKLLQGRILDPYAVLAELLALENPEKVASSTKPATLFRGGPLDGLMHKHFSTAQHIQRNIANVWTNTDRLDRTVGRLMKESPDQGQNELSNLIAHRLVVETMRHKRRARSITGDWIVYARHDAINHFLTLALHDEDTKEIRGRIDEQVAIEFPQLRLARGA